MIRSRISYLRSVLAVLVTAFFIGVCAFDTLMAAATNKPPAATLQTPVDVNSADLKTLETLPGVGPTLASRIVAGRPYKDLADLGKVKGLSKSKLDAIKDDVTFGAAATAQEKTTPSTAGKSAATTSQTTPAPTGHPSGKLTPGQTININRAALEDLEKLPGIGPTKAQAIIDYRTQNGDFKSIEDIEKVKGIKAGEFSKVKDYIKVTD
jgi:competence protein ComEA